MNNESEKDNFEYIVYDKNQGYVYLAWVMAFPIHESKSGSATFSTDLHPHEEEMLISEIQPIIVSREATEEIKHRYGKLAETDLIVYRLQQVFPI